MKAYIEADENQVVVKIGTTTFTLTEKTIDIRTEEDVKISAPNVELDESEPVDRHDAKILQFPNRKILS